MIELLRQSYGNEMFLQQEKGKQDGTSIFYSPYTEQEKEY